LSLSSIRNDISFTTNNKEKPKHVNKYIVNSKKKDNLNQSILSNTSLQNNENGKEKQSLIDNPINIDNLLHDLNLNRRLNFDEDMIEFIENITTCNSIAIQTMDMQI